jgi:hypothetical protein
MELIKLFLKVIINVLFVSLILGILFFTYAKNVENNVFQNNIKYLVDDFTETVKLGGPQSYALIKNKINTVALPDLSHEDIHVKKTNNDILKLAINANIMFLILVIGIVSALCYYNEVEIMQILVQNTIILIFIGLTEFAFLTYFASDYISVDPNKIKYALVKKLVS